MIGFLIVLYSILLYLGDNVIRQSVGCVPLVLLVPSLSICACLIVFAFSLKSGTRVGLVCLPVDMPMYQYLCIVHCMKAITSCHTGSTRRTVVLWGRRHPIRRPELAFQVHVDVGTSQVFENKHP